MNIESLIRPNILALKPYSSARHEFTGHGEVFPWCQWKSFRKWSQPVSGSIADRIEKISKIKQVSTDRIFLGNGSDEAIDLIFRIFCSPGVDEIIVLPPTYGMYQVSADIHEVKVNKVPLNAHYQPDIPTIPAPGKSTYQIIISMQS